MDTGFDTGVNIVSFPIYDNIINNWQKGWPLIFIIAFFIWFIYWLMKG